LRESVGLFPFRRRRPFLAEPDVPVKLIAVEDIGVFVGLAFQREERFAGRTIEIAGDALTPVRIADAVAKATGPPDPL